MDNNRCICCGEIIPEGRMVCPMCESGIINTQTKIVIPEEPKKKNKLLNFLYKKGLIK